MRDLGDKLNTSRCFKHKVSTDSDSPALTICSQEPEHKTPVCKEQRLMQQTQITHNSLLPNGPIAKEAHAGRTNRTHTV